MALFPPQPGQVIRYAYLWWNEARVGREDATKDRPCGIILTRIANSGNTIAYVLPITHTPPLNDEDGIEIPAATKQRLRLDAERSWIITTELINSLGQVLTSDPRLPASTYTVTCPRN
jgi:hypothetical protein